VGAWFREFSVTLAFAIAVSTVVYTDGNAHDLRAFRAQSAEPGCDVVRSHGRTLHGLAQGRLCAQPECRVGAACPDAGRHGGVLVLTTLVYIKSQKGYFPTDDTGLVWASTQASTEASYQSMFDLQQRAAEIVLADPAVNAVGSSIGTSDIIPRSPAARSSSASSRVGTQDGLMGCH